ncbi:MAG: nucleoside triphosphate pyrophosphohydrolase [Erysipelotrichaceae bacterium]|nr:nucleoside triphosphate pyrophosphohydrolase [Erysipelotrichaceae bacterium]
MITYNKIIRDNIPSIIEKDHKSCVVSVLDDEQFNLELKKKLIEEATEVLAATTREELIGEIADMHEIIDKLKEIYGIDDVEVSKVQRIKAEKNGKFEKKLFLVSVDDKHE